MSNSKLNQVLRFVLLSLFVLNAQYCNAQQYLAQYKIILTDVRPPAYFQAARDRMTAIINDDLSRGDVKAAEAHRLDRDSVRQDEGPKQPELFIAQIGQSKGDILYHLVNTVTKEQYTLLYKHDKDFTMSVDRPYHSVADVWLDKGLDTRKVSFLLITGLRSPFLRTDPRSGRLSIPLLAGPHTSDPGVVAEVFYRDADVLRNEDNTVLTTYLGPVGKDEEWDFTSSTKDTRLATYGVSTDVTMIDYRGMAIQPYLERKSRMVPGLRWEAHLTDFKNVDIDSNLFKPENWLSHSDTVIDNRHQGKTISFDPLIGNMDEQLAMDDRKAATPGRAVLYFIIAMTFALLAFLMYRRLQRLQR